MGTTIFSATAPGAPDETARAARNSPDERMKTGRVSIGANHAETPARNVPAAQPREPHAANVPITLSAERAYARRAGGYIPTQNPRKARVRRALIGSCANTWRNAARAPRTSPVCRILRLPWTSAARPNTYEATRTAPLYAATMNPSCSVVAPSWSAHSGMKIREAETAAVPRRLMWRGWRRPPDPGAR